MQTRASPPRNIELPTRVYSSVFSMRDGSELSPLGIRAVDTMILHVARLLDASLIDVSNLKASSPAPEISSESILAFARRNITDAHLWKILFLAVAGNSTVYQPRAAQAVPQQCSLVADPSSGELAFYDSSSTRSVILEVLLIICLLCLLRAWSKMR